MRDITFEKDNFYHLSNSGFLHREIFVDDTDRVRFLFMILHFQSPIKVNNSVWYTSNFIKKGDFRIGQDKRNYLLEIRNIKLLAFNLSSLGFDLIVKTIEKDIPSVYMHRILTGYGKYFNAKYKQKGHIFSGPFHAKKLKDSKELLDKSLFIHRPNKSSINNSLDYKWSSFVDYTNENRWGDFLDTEDILTKFKNQTEYKNFVLNG